jgi:hypothetical protein
LTLAFNRYRDAEVVEETPEVLHDTDEAEVVDEEEPTGPPET